MHFLWILEKMKTFLNTDVHFDDLGRTEIRPVSLLLDIIASSVLVFRAPHIRITTIRHWVHVDKLR